jgi:hypothetical protein
MTSSSQIASVLRSSRREALFVAVVWVLACGYTVGYAARFAYRTGEPLQLLFGIPTWVVWGVLAPWAVVTLITCWYAFAGIRDEELGDEPAGSGERGDEVTRG